MAVKVIAKVRFCIVWIESF